MTKPKPSPVIVGKFAPGERTPWKLRALREKIVARHWPAVKTDA
jgi:hypothetical protein